MFSLEISAKFHQDNFKFVSPSFFYPYIYNKTVVCVNQPKELARSVNDFCHSLKIHFIGCWSMGFFSNVFCDFGNHFRILNQTGEIPRKYIIGNILQVSK